MDNHLTNYDNEREVRIIIILLLQVVPVSLVIPNFDKSDGYGFLFALICYMFVAAKISEHLSSECLQSF